MNKRDILHLIEADKWMMNVLTTAKTLNLPDWYIGAGFVRGKIWDKLHGYSKRTPLPDIDLIYFDKSDFTQEESGNETTAKETKCEQELKRLMPEVNWSVTNQARMHLFHKDKPYSSSEEALSHWVETATCVGVKLNEKNELILAAPKGIDDLVNLILRPTSISTANIALFHKRVKEKNWLKKWPKLKVVA